MTFEPPPNTPARERERKEMNPIVKMVLELGPLAIFFFANARGDWLAGKLPALAELGGPLFVATALFIVATLISLAVSLALTRRLPIMPFVTAIVVVVFGGLTLYLHDETFIKMKATIVYMLFGSLLLGGLPFGKSLLGYVLDSAFKLTDEGWRILTFRWGLFFFFLAILNEIVWRNFSTDTWVSFKVFGIVPLFFLFTLSQLPLLNRTQVEDEAEAP